MKKKTEQMTKIVVNSIECKDNLFAPTVTVPGSLDLYQWSCSSNAILTICW